METAIGMRMTWILLHIIIAGTSISNNISYRYSNNNINYSNCSNNISDSYNNNNNINNHKNNNLINIEKGKSDFLSPKIGKNEICNDDTDEGYGHDEVNCISLLFVIYFLLF